MVKIENPELGDYVLLSSTYGYSRGDPHCVGFVSRICNDIKMGMSYTCEGVNRYYRHCYEITPEEGQVILDISELETARWNGEDAYPIFLEQQRKNSNNPHLCQEMLLKAHREFEEK